MTAKPIILAFGLLLALAGCRNTKVKIFDHTIAGGAGQQDLRPLRYGAARRVSSFDPNGPAGWCEASALLHARLFTIDDRGRVIPDLAESARPEAGGRRWKITLRSGLRFHDRTPLTAADVVATLARVADDSRSPTGRSLGVIRAARALSETELSVELASPVGELPERLTALAILPRDRVGRGDAFEREPVGAGPYRRLAHEDGVVFFAAHGDYHRGRPHAEFLTLVIIEDARRRALALSDGVVDLACVAPEDLSLFADVERFRRHRCRLGTTQVILLDEESPGLTEAAVRRALGALVPRQRVVTEGLANRGRPAWQLFSPSALAFDPDADGPRMTREQASSHLDAAGWPRGADGSRRDATGRRLQVALGAAGAGDRMTRSLDSIREAWREAGITIANGEKNDAVLVAVPALVAPIAVMECLPRLREGELRPGAAPALAAALAEAGRGEALGPRIARAREAQQRLLEDATVIPVANEELLFVMHRDVTGFEPEVADSPEGVARFLWRVEVAVGAAAGSR